MIQSSPAPVLSVLRSERVTFMPVYGSQIGKKFAKSGLLKQIGG